LAFQSLSFQVVAAYPGKNLALGDRLPLRNQNFPNNACRANTDRYGLLRSFHTTRRGKGLICLR
jgi:hypothetical protein